MRVRLAASIRPAREAESSGGSAIGLHYCPTGACCVMAMTLPNTQWRGTWQQLTGAAPPGAATSP